MDRIALVTGACGGIGKSICHRLASDGFRVFATDLDDADAMALSRELPGPGHVGLALDVADEASVERVIHHIEERFGAIAVLAAAAGILILDETGTRRPITDTSLGEWTRTQEVNSTGTFLLLRAFFRARRDRPVSSARFIGLSSVAAQLGGYRSSSSYIASKSAVLGLIRAAAREGAALDVSVNAVAPGLVDAPMLRLSLNPADDAAVAASIPQGRIGRPEDVAGAVSFLAGPDSAYITGAVIDVNGGYRMQ